MDAGNGLHHASVTDAEAAPIGGFHHAGIGRTVLGDRNTRVAFDHAGHARCPQDFIVKLAIDKTMRIVEKFKRIREVTKWRGDQFEQGFGVIGGDMRMSQRGAQAGRMRGLCDAAINCNPEAFLFQADLAASQHLPDIASEQVGDTLFNHGAQYDSLYTVRCLVCMTHLLM